MTSADDSTHLEGRCHCGAVTVRVPRSAFGVVACHCDDCQKLHGNFFAMLAAERASVQLDGGDAVQAYASSPTATRTFCRHCGSRIAKDARDSPRLLLAAGLFGRETGLRLRKSVWGQSKPDWYELPAEQA